MEWSSRVDEKCNKIVRGLRFRKQLVVYSSRSRSDVCSDWDCSNWRYEYNKSHLHTNDSSEYIQSYILQVDISHKPYDHANSTQHWDSPWAGIGNFGQSLSSSYCRIIMIYAEDQNSQLSWMWSPTFIYYYGFLNTYEIW